MNEQIRAKGDRVGPATPSHLTAEVVVKNMVNVKLNNEGLGANANQCCE